MLKKKMLCVSDEMMIQMDYLSKFSRLQGPVVQSIVSLTKALVNDSLSLLVRLKSSVLIFFAEKMWWQCF